MKLTTKSGREFELDPTDVLVNEDPMLPTHRSPYNPHNCRLWIIGHEYGPIVALWATCEQDALDEMLDRGYEHFLVQPEDIDPELEKDGFYAHIGNAGEPCDLSYAWIEEVVLDRDRDFEVCVAFAAAAAAGDDDLDRRAM